MIDLAQARHEIEVRNRIRVEANLPPVSVAAELRHLYKVQQQKRIRAVLSVISYSTTRRTEIIEPHKTIAERSKMDAYRGVVRGWTCFLCTDKEDHAPHLADAARGMKMVWMT